MTNPIPVIIVRKKASHEGHHGGAWKVAYADFVTAMMAFFLVMWLVGQSKEVRAGVGGYFRDPGAFDGGTGVLPGGASLDAAPAAAVSPTEQVERARLEQAVSNIRSGLERNDAFKTLRDQVQFTVTPEGLRIDLLDQSSSSFFDSGSATLRDETERILGVIAHELGSLNHEVVIEGHTDSHPYAQGERYSNWDLSTDRANAARRVMDREGLRPEQVTSVTGFADRRLRTPEDPFDPRNRRVSILVKSPLLSAAPKADDHAGLDKHDMMK